MLNCPYWHRFENQEARGEIINRTPALVLVLALMARQMAPD